MHRVDESRERPPVGLGRAPAARRGRASWRTAGRRPPRAAWARPRRAPAPRRSPPAPAAARPRSGRGTPSRWTPRTRPGPRGARRAGRRRRRTRGSRPAADRGRRPGRAGGRRGGPARRGSTRPRPAPAAVGPPRRHELAQAAVAATPAGTTTASASSISRAIGVVSAKFTGDRARVHRPDDPEPHLHEQRAVAPLVHQPLQPDRAAGPREVEHLDAAGQPRVLQGQHRRAGGDVVAAARVVRHHHPQPGHGAVATAARPAPGTPRGRRSLSASLLLPAHPIVRRRRPVLRAPPPASCASRSG